MADFLKELLNLRQTTKTALLAKAHMLGVEPTIVVEDALRNKGKASVRLDRFGNQELTDLWDIYIDVGDVILNYLHKNPYVGPRI